MTCANGSPPLGLLYGNITLATGIVSRGIGLAIGNPAQLVSLKPSTGDDDIWIYNAQDCVSDTDHYCLGYNGGVFNSSKSRTYSSTTLAAWNGTGLGDETTTQLAQNVYFNDEIAFGKNGTAFGYPMVMEKQGNSNVSTGLGIGQNSTFLDQAVKSGSAPTKAYGLWVGSRSIADPVDGTMWLGGYDTSRVNGQFTQFPTFPDCPTCIVVSSLEYNGANGPTSLFSNSSETITIALQPYTRYLEVPSDVYANLITASTAENTYNGLIDSLATFKSTAQMGNVSVTFSNGYKTVIPAQELFFPPRGIDDNGVYTITNNTFQISMFYNTSVAQNIVFNWGIPILTPNYLVVDYDAQNFKLAPARQGAYTESNGALVSPLCSGIAAVTATPVSTPSASSSASASAAASGGSHTNVGAIAGGVVGGIAGLAIIFVLAWFILRGKKREKTLKEERDAAMAQGSEAGNVHERMSQYTATSPTEVSEIDGGGPTKAHQYGSVNQWVHQQQESQYSQPPNSPPPPSHANTHTSATLTAPVEMPAFQYR